MAAIDTTPADLAAVCRCDYCGHPFVPNQFDSFGEDGRGQCDGCFAGWNSLFAIMIVLTKWPMTAAQDRAAQVLRKYAGRYGIPEADARRPGSDTRERP